MIKKILKKVLMISLLCTIIIGFSNVPIYGEETTKTSIESDKTVLEYETKDSKVSLQASKEDATLQNATLQVIKDVNVTEALASLQTNIVSSISYQLELQQEGVSLQPQKDVTITITLPNKTTLTNKQTVSVYQKQVDNTLTTLTSTPVIKEETLESISFQTATVSTFIVVIEETASTKTTTQTTETKSSTLTTIPTVSTKDLINMTVYDYKTNDYSQTLLGDNTRTGARQGLVSTTLQEDGFPTITGPGRGKGQSLSQLYDASNTANISKVVDADGLFQQDSNGYYHYNSQENYAYLKEDGNFELYDRIASPAPRFPKGNFFPFNPLAADAKIMKKSENGKDLYNLTTGTGAKAANNGFGMMLDFDFMQPQDGKVHGEDMIFEFSGDDDVFVYIDGVLVLDIGGSHAPVTGSINFSTGKVNVSQVAVAATNYGKSTTLQKLFEEVTGDTFDNWTKHSFKFFYTDRGGASNCKIKFNLPVVPKDSLSVIKEIDGMNDAIYSDLDFTFQLELDGQIQNGLEYVIYGEGTTGETKTITNNYFTLKHGQMAIFKDIDINKKYKIHEININQTDFNKVSINDKQVDITSGKASSPTYTVGIDKTVLVKNTCSKDLLSNLSISKKMKTTDNQDYKMKVMIGNSLYYGKYYIGNEEKIANAGIITLKPGQVAVIKDIPTGTSFEISEVDLDLRLYKTPVYAIQDASNIDISNIAKGTIERKKNAIVTITNEKGLGSITVNKTIVENENVHGDPIFTFKISGSDGSVLYRTFRFSNDQTGTKQFTIDNLPLGVEYTIKELSSIRYDLIDTIQTNNATADFQNHQAYTTLYIDSSHADITFTNQKNYIYNFSHSDVITNTFVVGKKIEKNTLIEERSE